MTPERWQRVRQALDEAAELSPQERAKFLIRLRQGDAETAVEVEALLGPENREASWLDQALSRRGGFTLPDLNTTGTSPPPLEKWPAQVGPYALQEELARGGMGVVLRARDDKFNRAVAVKILRQPFAGDPAMVQRFLDEAQLMGRLQHPGIPPVHDRGELPDGRPYLAMKLIKGRTLAELLRDASPGSGETAPDRAHRARSWSRWLPIFEQVCHTIAYAHSRGVIHRDLKPGNIMVGAFGEVQVMDWGLAKVLKAGAEDPSAGLAANKSEQPSTFFLAGAAPARGETLAGSVMGTLAYMAPEQARGEIDALDERCDVFGLGAILCEILTGAAPFAADSEANSIRLARGGDVGTALARLDASGADADLRLLATRCLAPERHDRPRRAQEVADTVRNHLAELQRRLRHAEIEQAAAQVRAEEEYKRRMVGRRWATVVAALALIAAAAGAWYFIDRDRAEQAARNRFLEKDVAAALDLEEHGAAQLDNRLADYAQAQELISDPEVWKQGLDQRQEALIYAERLLGSGPPDLDLTSRQRLHERREQLRRDLNDLAVAKELDDLHLEAFTLTDDNRAAGTVAVKYAGFFAERVGIDLEGGNEAAQVERIKASRLRHVLLAALDHWAELSADTAMLPRLLLLARRADPDPWRDRFRQETAWKDRKYLELLAAEVQMQRQAPHTLITLAGQLERTQGNGMRVLEAALVHHPHSFWLNLTMAGQLKYSTEKAGYCQAALAVRPKNSVAWNILGAALVKQHKLGEALGALGKAVEFNPKDGVPHHLVGKIHRSQGRFADAERASQLALARLAPDHPLHAIALEQCKECQRCLELQRQEKLQPVEDWKHGLQGRLTPADPLDLYLGISKSPRKAHVVLLEPGKHYQIDLRSLTRGFDPILRLETADWKPLLENDDILHPEDLNSRLVFTPRDQGLYRLIVNGYKVKVAGDYTLTLREAIPAGEPQLLSGELTKSSKKDNVGKYVEEHKLAVTADTRYVIELESQRFDTYLRLHDGGQKLLAINDDVAPGNFQQSRLDFTPSESGTYLVGVTSYQAGETGTYSLRIHAYRPPP